jgi:hypothetical protein
VTPRLIRRTSQPTKGYDITSSIEATQANLRFSTHLWTIKCTGRAGASSANMWLARESSLNFFLKYSAGIDRGSSQIFPRMLSCELSQCQGPSF